MSKPLHILIVDDDESTRRLLKSVLSAEGHSCQVAENLETAESLLRQNPIHLALVDIYLGNSNGLEFVKQVKALQPDCACVMMTAQGSVETAARSVTEGALEYLGKPLLIDDLLALIRRLQSQRRQSPAECADPEASPTSIVGRSPKMLEVYRAIARVAPSSASVLIVGASGTGKELVARAIHTHSRRVQMPFTPINCGSLPETILESELFGSEKGAFTGADKSRVGLFEVTNRGTLFLDEVSETSLSFQVKLLRVVQEQQVRRLGSNTHIPVDVRIVAATNKDLAALIRLGRFREDLYYRLSVVTIPVPSLEERREDIPLLVAHFLERFNQRNQRPVVITDETLRLLTAMAWPGNVRELENMIERLAIFSTTGEITMEDVESERIRSAPATSNHEPVPTTLRDMERQHIVRVLRETGGNKSQAAKRLGIERKTLHQKVLRLGIEIRSEKP
jgi:DNA-binding NtrC family response regulator